MECVGVISSLLFAEFGMRMCNPKIPFLLPSSCHVSSPPLQGESFSDVTILSDGEEF